MIYTIRSKQNIVAVLRTWDGKVTDTRSVSGHWTWCVGRQVTDILEWTVAHYMRWSVGTREVDWLNAIDEIEQRLCPASPK